METLTETFANACGSSSHSLRFHRVTPRAVHTQSMLTAPALWASGSKALSTALSSLRTASPSSCSMIYSAWWSGFHRNTFKNKILISSGKKKENEKAWPSFQGEDKGNKGFALFGLLNFKGYACQFEKCMISPVCLLKVLFSIADWATVNSPR